jgi:hypothetical protein
MNSANLPILYQNIIFGLPSDLAQDAFLFASDHSEDDPMLYKAEAFAREVDFLVRALTPMLDAAAKLHGQNAHPPDLMGFILKRHANWRFGGNVAPAYAGAA